MKRTISALALIAAFACGAAQAADLPLKSPPQVFVPPAPVFTWNGLYGGLNIGGGWESNNYWDNNGWGGGGWNGWGWNGYNNSNNRGYVVGGGQVGYNFMFSPMFMIGAETDIQGASGNLEWFGTVRGRVGIVPFSPNLLIYGTGGFAYGQTHDYYDNGLGALLLASPITPAGGNLPFGGVGLAGLAYWNNNYGNQVKTGWTAGGGLEWAFTPNLSAKVEYLYVALYNNNNNWNNWGWGSNVSNFHHNENIIRIGVNYHWNPAPAPVVAKY
jgi:outer membrane immunogenic protein